MTHRHHPLVAVLVCAFSWPSMSCGDGAVDTDEGSTASPDDSDADTRQDDGSDPLSDASSDLAPEGGDTALGVDDSQDASPSPEVDDTSAGDTASPTGDAAEPDTWTPPLVPPCPAITVDEGTAIAPPLTLHLSGRETTGTVASWTWSLDSGPAGLASAFLPSAHAQDVTFEAALGGTYVFRLDARDASGLAACPAATLTIRAVPTSAVHLELVWDDQTENPAAPIGADLDLHVLHMTHPDASGLSVDGDATPDVWFDPVYDCAWHNPDVSWTPGVSDGTPTRCRLLRRDDAGYGPEVITLDALAPETVYTVGFHVWDDEEAVYLAPTEIRIWIDGVLKNKPTFSVPVSASDLWRVMTVRYPSGILGFPFEKDGDFRPTSPSK